MLQTNQRLQKRNLIGGGKNAPSDVSVMKASIFNKSLTLKVLNFWTFIETWSGWVFDSYWSLKPLCSGMGEVVPARTSATLPPPSPRTVLQLPCFKVSQCINCHD